MTTETNEVVAQRASKQSDLLDKLVHNLALKNDAALSKAMHVHPPVVSKIRSGKMPFGPSYIIIAHELTGWPIAQIKSDLGID